MYSQTLLFHYGPIPASVTLDDSLSDCQLRIGSSFLIFTSKYGYFVIVINLGYKQDPQVAWKSRNDSIGDGFQ
jgi:hypothetical protein